MSQFENKPLNTFDYNLYNFRASPDHGSQDYRPTKGAEYLRQVPKNLGSANTRVAGLIEFENGLRQYDWIQSVSAAFNSTTSEEKSAADLQFQTAITLARNSGVQKQISGVKADYYPRFMAEAARYASLDSSQHGQLIMVAHQIKGIQSHNDVARTIRSLITISGHTRVPSSSQAALESYLKTHDADLRPMKEAASQVIFALREVRTGIRAAAKNTDGAESKLIAQIKTLNLGLGTFHQKILEVSKGHVDYTGEINPVSADQRSTGQKLLIRLRVLVALIALLVAALWRTNDEQTPEATQG